MAAGLQRFAAFFTPLNPFIMRTNSNNSLHAYSLDDSKAIDIIDQYTIDKGQYLVTIYLLQYIGIGFWADLTYPPYKSRVSKNSYFLAFGVNGHRPKVCPVATTASEKKARAEYCQAIETAFFPRLHFSNLETKKPPAVAAADGLR